MHGLYRVREHKDPLDADQCKERRIETIEVYYNNLMLLRSKVSDLKAWKSKIQQFFRDLIND